MAIFPVSRGKRRICPRPENRLSLISVPKGPQASAPHVAVGILTSRYHMGAIRTVVFKMPAFRHGESEDTLSVSQGARCQSTLIGERKPKKGNHIKEFGGRNAPEASQG